MFRFVNRKVQEFKKVCTLIQMEDLEFKKYKNEIKKQAKKKKLLDKIKVQREKEKEKKLYLRAMQCLGEHGSHDFKPCNFEDYWIKVCQRCGVRYWRSEMLISSCNCVNCHPWNGTQETSCKIDSIKGQTITYRSCNCEKCVARRKKENKIREEIENQ